MQLQTILNHIQRHKSFVYDKAHLLQTSSGLELEVVIQPRKNGRPLCSSCQRPGPCYDHLPTRRFEFVPLWGIAVFFLYAMRRVDCSRCGVKVEQVPWAEGKNALTTTYRWFLAQWAKRLPWKQVATAFGTTWDAVYSSVYMAVVWGLDHRSLEGITAIGVDEIQWLRGHHYVTLVYEISAGAKRLLWIGKDRTEKSFEGFFDMLGRARCAALEFICTDMWKPYLAVIGRRAKQAINILDRFHIMKKMNEGLDEIRADEGRRLKQDGYEPVLKHSRWCLLKRPENLTPKQTVKLSELLKYNLRSVRAYLQREDFQRFWTYQSRPHAARFLKEWCGRVMRSKLEPMKKVVRMLRAHEPLILNWFRAQGTMSSGIVEGMNNNVKVIMRKAYGFRTFRALEVALYHGLGELPEPNFTHRFC